MREDVAVTRPVCHLSFVLHWLYFYMHIIFQLLWVFQRWPHSWLVSKVFHLTWLPRDNTFALIQSPFWQYLNTGLFALFCANKELLVEGHRQYKMMMWKGGPSIALFHISNAFDSYKLILGKHSQKQWFDIPVLCRPPQTHSVFCLFHRSVADELLFAIQNCTQCLMPCRWMTLSLIDRPLWQMGSDYGPEDNKRARWETTVWD